MRNGLRTPALPRRALSAWRWLFGPARRILGPALLVFLLMPFPAASQEGEIIQAIEIEGLRQVKPERVLYVLPVRVGQPYRLREPGEIVHAIYNLGLFNENVQVYREAAPGGIKLIIVVQENPSIQDIQFVGNTQLSAKALEEALPIKRGALVEPDTNVQVRTAVEKAYRNKGFSGASAMVNAIDRSDTETVIQVVVNEGQRLKIKDLILRGNESVSAAALKLQLENKGSWLFIANFYDSDAFQLDLDMVRLYYLARGYLDVDVRAGEFIHDSEQRWVSPVIEIREGPRYRVGEIRPAGFTVWNREQILEPFAPLAGQHYDVEKFREALEALKNKYGDEGYINTEISFDYDANPQTQLVNFDLRIDEHERVYVREIQVRKNEYPLENPTLLERVHGRISPPVTDEVIRREVMLKPGEAYRRFQEVATVDRLQSLGIFQDVKAEAALTDDETKRDAVLTVEEGNTGNIIAGIGLSEWAGAYVHGGYINRNLFGQARHLRTSFLLGTRDVQFRIGYFDRYFDLPGTRLDQWFQEDNPSGIVPFRVELFRDALRLREYEEIHTGASAVVTRLSRRGLLTQDFGARLEYVQTDDNGRSDSSWGFFGGRDDDDDDDDPDEDFGDYPVMALSYYIEEDTTDDWWWPTRGHILGGGAEVGFADGPLVKFNGRYALYRKLNEWLIYALNTRVGWMPFGADEVGISERLFLGGAGDMRGFAFRGAGPTDDKNDDLHIGGSLKAVAQNELRFPIYKQLKGFAFVDVGMLGEDPFEVDAPRVSTGLGIRFSTARPARYAPRWRSGFTELDLMRGFHVEVSLGAPIIKDGDDDEQFLHFVLGSAF